MKKKLRIAMIGQKGIPARYGGVETHVQEIATRLAARGHDVWVYCRKRFRPDAGEVTGHNGYEQTPEGLRYKGVYLAFRPSVNTKHLDAATHSLYCAFETSVRQSFDIVHFHGIGPAAFIPMAKGTRQTIISTVHALDWRQVKWGGWAKKRLLQGEKLAVTKSAGVIAVSKILAEYIDKQYGVHAQHIPNGAIVVGSVASDKLEQFGLTAGEYALTVGRIIRDRGLHDLIAAFKRVQSPVKLAIVGSEVPRTSYTDELRAMANDRVVFTGDRYGEELAQLYGNCQAYVLASSVEGLPITVCEAMGYGRAVLLSNIPENREAGGDVAEYFKVGNVNDLQEKLDMILEPNYDRAARGEAGRRRVEAHFTWDRLAEEVEKYYFEVLAKQAG